MLIFRKRYFFKLISALLLCFSFPVFVFSQVVELQLDSVAPDTIGHKHKISVKPAFDFDQRFSFIHAKEVNIWGERAGMLINDKFKVGIGVYVLNDHLKSKALDANGSAIYNAHRDLYFGTCYFEPFVFRYKFVEFSVPIEAGYGKSVFRVYTSSENSLVNTTISNFLPTGAGLSLSFKLPPIGRFKPTRWFGLNFLAGYRYCFLENVFRTDYDGMFWSISGAIFLDRVSDDCHYWKQKRKARKVSAAPGGGTYFYFN